MIIYSICNFLFVRSRFSAVAAIKSTSRSKINIEPEMMVATFNFIPELQNVCSAKQTHTSFQ